MFYHISSFLFFLVLFLGYSPNTLANPIPPQLESWVPWVQSQIPNINCPHFERTALCVWHGKLDLSANSTGANFVMNLSLDETGEFDIIGNTEYWPQNVKINGENITVLDRKGTPFLKLDKGNYQITGNIPWEQTPERITVPTSIGQITLYVDGQNIEYPRFEDQFLYLGEQKVEVTETDSIRASIYRKILDEIPLKIITRVDIQVGGRAREIDLGTVVLKNSRPTLLSTSISAQINNEGNLKVYTGPGSHRIEFTSIMEEEPKTISATQKNKDIYDPQEIWVWSPNETIRSVTLSGVLAIDPNMTSLPNDWKGSTTYQVNDEQVLTFTTTRRGMQDTSPDFLNLSRNIWLSLDGTKYRISDTVNGQLNRGNRINFQETENFHLGRVYTNTDKLLITKDQNNNVGVELRTTNISIQAESLLHIESTSSKIPIVGWDHDVQSLQVDLHVPPGWTLLGGTGIDKIYGDWISTWRLWDFFFILLIAMGTGKVLGWKWSILVIPTLCLTHNFGEAPKWIWIHLLFSLALLKVLQDGKFRKFIVFYRGFCLVILLFILLPFVRTQIRYGMNPQLSTRGNYHSIVQFQGYYKDVYEEEEEYPESRPSRLAVPQKAEGKSKGRSDEEQYSNITKSNMLQQIDPNAIVQTGMGLPTWSWNTKKLTWNGPVDKSHEIELWLISPQQNFFLSILRVLLLVILSFVMIAPKYMYWSEPFKKIPDWLGKFDSKILTLLGVLFMGGFYSNPAEADNFPTPQILEELKNKLVQDMECTEPCATFSTMSFQVQGQKIFIEGEVHAQKDSGISLPGSANTIHLTKVLIDGKNTLQLRRHNNFVMVRIPRGVHNIAIEGILPNKNVITIPIKEIHKAKYTTFQSSDWTVDGIDRGKTKNSIQLTRVESTSSTPNDAEKASSLDSNISPWYTVKRVLLLGLPWTIQTTVQRTSFETGSLMKVPLLEGERIITDEIRVDENEALIEFPRNIKEISYESEIPITEQFSLVASAGKNLSEIWIIECNRIWQCSFSDLPKIKDTEANFYGSSNKKVSTWYPWPNERLDINVSKPTGIEGNSFTVDEVTYEITPGTRLLAGVLKLSIRASQGGTQQITLPPDAELQTVLIDNVEKNIRPQNGIVSLPLVPGKRVFILKWQQNWERNLYEEMPTIKIGSQAVNATNIIHLDNEERILLWTNGPEWGPVILFWSHLTWLLIFALIISRFQQIPVKTYEWFLLFLGLSQVDVEIMFFLIGWFVYIYWREQRQDFQSKVFFNIHQIFVAGLTFLVILIVLGTIHQNLTSIIDMQIQGNGSSRQLLKWYQDEIQDVLPTVSIFSIPQMFYRIVMLIWSFWLVSAMMRWANWGFKIISKQGLWLGIEWSNIRQEISMVEDTFITKKQTPDTTTDETEVDSNSSEKQNSTNDEEKKDQNSDKS